MAKAINNQVPVLSEELVVSRIYFIRGRKIMIDSDLSVLYQVPTKRLNEQVTRNIVRFPEDFMFQLTVDELVNLKSQFATSSLPAGNKGWGGNRKLPYAFTEQGVAMLSGVLKSQTAIRVNIQIIRVFIKMQEVLMTNKDILLQLEKAERKLTKHDEDISLIFQYLEKLLNPPALQRQRIGLPWRRPPTDLRRCIRRYTQIE